jgi:hypothetical protein
MAQSLEVNIKTTSDVPQATEKAKTAVVSFGKQVEDIQKKFSTAFKDIFLGFTAPMVLLQSAISYISAAMAEARQNAKEGLDLISQGKTAFASSEEARAAAFFKRKKELDDERKLVEAGRADITRQILANENGQFKDFVLPEQYVRKLREGSATMESLAKNKEVQRIALEYFTKTDEGRRLSEGLGVGVKTEPTPTTPTGFKGPEGFGNVVGVGANPVMEAMTLQLEESRKQTALLESLNNKQPGGGVPTDFTKTTQPSRAALLKGGN